MTEDEWLAGTDPTPMLEYLHRRLSDRKLILFAAACCRHIWPLLSDVRYQAAVEVAERFADGRAVVKELYAARTPTINAERSGGAAARAVYWTANALPTETVGWVHAAAAEAETRDKTQSTTSNHEAAWNNAYSAAIRSQADLLRDIVGNPFRPPSIERAWLRWAAGTVPRIALDIYEERRFEELPVLADALEDAGCDHAELLAHCRSGGEHARGCWLIDLLLERQ